MSELKAGHEVRIVALKGKDTPRFMIGRVGKVVACPDFTGLTPELIQYISDACPHYKVEMDGRVLDMYYSELEIPRFQSSDYETI